MHEASIAASVVDYITSYEKENKFIINKIVIEAGKGSGTSGDALGFCLSEMMKAMQRDITVEFVETPIAARCSDCGEDFILDYPTYVCPGCRGLTLDIISGMELNILELEGDEREG